MLADHLLYPRKKTLAYIMEAFDRLPRLTEPAYPVRLLQLLLPLVLVT